jgi:hypothetical protein
MVGEWTRAVLSERGRHDGRDRCGERVGTLDQRASEAIRGAICDGRRQQSRHLLRRQSRWPAVPHDQGRRKHRRGGHHRCPGFHDGAEGARADEVTRLSWTRSVPWLDRRSRSTICRSSQFQRALGNPTLPFSCPLGATNRSKQRQRAAQSEGRNEASSMSKGARSGSVQHNAANGG